MQEKERLSSKSQLVTGQMKELKELTESMKEENEKLANSWKTLAEVGLSSTRFNITTCSL